MPGRSAVETLHTNYRATQTAHATTTVALSHTAMEHIWQELQRLWALEDCLADIMAASEGVAGWNLNESIAPWEQFEGLAPAHAASPRSPATQS